MTQPVFPVSALPVSSIATNPADSTQKEAQRILWLLKARANINQWDILEELDQLEVILKAYAWATTQQAAPPVHS